MKNQQILIKTEKTPLEDLNPTVSDPYFVNGNYAQNPLLEEGFERELEKPECKNYVFWSICGNCGDIKKHPHTCNQRYGRCCYEERKKRNYARLISQKIRTTRLIHVVIGFKKNGGSPNKLHKKDMERSLVKLHKKVRKKLNYSFNGLRIFDLADDGCYEHYHYALFPEKAFMNGRSLEIDVVKIRKLLKKVSHGKSEIIKVIGFRSKRSLFSYFSKRISGRYGHREKTFFLEDVMSYEQYKINFYNVRNLVKIGNPEGLSRIHAQSSFICRVCGSEDIHIVEKTLIEEADKPPDWLLEEQKNIRTGKLGGFI